MKGDDDMSLYPKSIVYSQNKGLLTKQQQETIHNTNVMIIGLGGLGGHVANNLVRLGVQRFTLVDFDVYTPSNLNRQLFSSLSSIGLFKVDVIRDELDKINDELIIHPVRTPIETINIEQFQSIDFLIDCTDTLKTKLHIVSLGSSLNIPVLHGSCGGWYGQVGWIMQGCKLLNDLYADSEYGIENQLLNPSFTPAFTASYMTAEFVKMITNEHPCINEILFIDLLNNKINLLGKGD